MPAPDKLTIDTPEQIALEFTVATVGSRFLAIAIDTIIQVAVQLALLTIFLAARWIAGGDTGGPGTWVMAIWLLASFTIYFGYFVYFEAMWRGQTPGKRVIGLRVIHASGRPISTYEAILRNLVRLVDQLPGIYAVGILTIFITERSQRLGDLAAETIVVHEQPIEAPSLGEAPSPVPRTHHGAGRLAAEEIALVETFLRRRDELFGVRELRARQIADRIRARLGSASDEGDEAFLEQVAAEYRTQGRYR